MSSTASNDTRVSAGNDASSHASVGLTGHRLPLVAVAGLSMGLSAVGIGWGLPNRDVDKYLFPAGQPWPGETIYRLAKADQKLAPERLAGTGADVDVDPLGDRGREWIPLTVTDQDVAGILLRYRLYTHQPDEMITMMALAGMRPGQLRFDPRLYQYGGLFIYPVGALIKVCGLLGLIDVRGDVAFYLDHPEEFGKFYIVARAYSATWGVIGVFVTWGIGRRLGRSPAAGILAALLYTVMPVVVCMAHEGKPHLPGAVLMLLAAYLAIRHLDSAVGDRFFFLMCAACGAALGMVLSSWPIFALIPLVAFLQTGGPRRVYPGGERTTAPAGLGHGITITALGTALGVGVYLISNPYIAINALFNRDVLASNFGNSFAMYEISRIGEGFVRVAGLTAEGATLPIAILGVTASIAVVCRRRWDALPLLAGAGLFFVQFVLIGAGKPAEYGRFGIFPNTALAIGAAAALTSPSLRRLGPARWPALGLVIAWTGCFGAIYVWNFRIDTTENSSRLAAAEVAARIVVEAGAHGESPCIVLAAEPAPYSCPPLPFPHLKRVYLRRSDASGPAPCPDAFGIRVVESPSIPPVPYGRRVERRPPGGTGWRFETPISWANKPFELGPLPWGSASPKP